MYRTRKATPSRDGMILMVVLALLTLFAIIGITFVLYSESAALSARFAKEAESLTRPDMNPEECFALVMGQLLYDVNDDNQGVVSALRGQSLARNMYGWRDDGTVNSNNTAFNGIGRVHSTFGAADGNFNGLDNWQLINHTFFKSAGDLLRDPECIGTRTDPSAAKAQYVGGANPPYTYPDLNHLFLGAVRASTNTATGYVIARSFHRDYTGFGPFFDPATGLASTKWTANTTAADKALKYMVLRPRPAEHPNFPLPEDSGGDVKNLTTSPGYLDPAIPAGANNLVNNDSFWMDIGAPILTATDGRKYKMLVAPFITDLDGRIDVNAVGNIRGPGNTPISNMGFGPWEINPNLVLSGTDWANLFLGRTNPTVQGKYGPDGKPLNGGVVATSGRSPHGYSQCDFDGGQGYNGTNCTALSGGTPYAFGNLAPPKLYPDFPTGYENGTTTAGANTERTDHPLLYNVPRPSYIDSTHYDRRIGPAHLEKLLRFGQTGYQSMVSDLERLSPLNFNDPADGIGQSTPSFKRRLLVTTNSADPIMPGLTPWIFDPTAAATKYAVNAADPYAAPNGAAIQYPALPYAAPPAGTSEFGTDWRAKSAYQWVGPASSPLLTALSRINLNRKLTPYPLGDPNPSTDPQSTATYNRVFTAGAIKMQADQALADRQKFADDIYRRLLLVCGVPPAANPAAPIETDLAPRRWLAQLAVNIVDYIDEDDIITPFNFYNTTDDPGVDITLTGTPPTTPQAPPNTELPKYWVFGTERPHVVLNEVMAQSENADATPDTQTIPAPPYHVAVWAELLNTLKAPPSQAPGQPQDGFAVKLISDDNTYAPYQIVIANGLYINATPSNDNVLGTPNFIKAQTALADWTAPAFTFLKGGAPGMQAAPSPSINADAVPANPAAPPFFLLAPPNAAPYTNSPTFRDVLKPGNAAPLVPDNVPFIRSANMTYQPTGPNNTFTQGGANPPDERVTGLTILLRRLANPHLPANPNPGTADYNPYVTVDYFEKVPIRGGNVGAGASLVDGPTLASKWPSRGKQQPFASLTNIQPGGAKSPVSTTLPSSPTREQTPQDPLGVAHTFGLKSAPLAANNSWLIHPDRQVVSPIELLHVSAYPPYLLGQKFVSNSPYPVAVAPSTGSGLFGSYNHTAPWFDQGATAGPSYRLYRLLEFLDTNNRGAGVAPNGRISGKININTIWDIETFRALCDANSSNYIWTITNSAVTIDTIYSNLINSRTPGVPSGYAAPYTSPALPRDIASTVGNVPAWYTGMNDRPFLSLATGFTQGAAGTQLPTVGFDRGIEDTLLRSFTISGKRGRLLQAPGDITSTAVPLPHPALQYQLLAKLFNNVTTRSNVFAIWLTVGFFEVEDATTTPPTLGKEIGRAEGRNIRHRMFAIVDRSNMLAFQATTAAATPTVNPDPYGGQDKATGVVPGPLSGTDSRTNRSWSIGTGTVLVYEPNTDNEETVIVQPANMATFTKNHAAGVPVVVRGNPGPWTRYDPRKDTDVVIHWNIID